MNPPANWVDETTPSPTSVLGVNVRYYHLIVQPLGVEEYIDVGATVEGLVEALYSGYIGPDKEAGFARATRGAFLELFEALHAVYPLHLITCLATGDVGEVALEAAHRQHLITSMRSRMRDALLNDLKTPGHASLRSFFS